MGRECVALLVTAAVLVCAGCAVAWADTDTAYWNELAIEGGITERLSAGIASKYRYQDNASRHYYTSTEIELNYRFLDWLSTGLGYKEVYKLKKAAWQQENRPYVQTEMKWKWADWKLKNRLRVEHREKQSADPYYRVRDKLTVKAPWKFTSLEINPYVADEIFVEHSEGAGFDENRTYAGVELRLAEHLRLGVYYLYVIEASNREWTSRVNVIGTALTLEY